MLKVLPYNKKSKTANDLVSFFDGRVKLIDDIRKSNENDLILNWGNSHFNLLPNRYYINLPISVKSTVNKLKTFKILEENFVNIPEYTRSWEEAQEWCNRGSRVFARYEISSYGGKGIDIYEPRTYINNLNNYKFYTLFVPKKQEFRVHVFHGKVIDVTEKKAKYDKDESYSPYIRSRARGWTFCRSDIKRNESAEDLAVKAVKALKLDFGAVDAGITHDGSPIIFEINSAPGLEGTSLYKYAMTIGDLFDV